MKKLYSEASAALIVFLIFVSSTALAANAQSALSTGPYAYIPNSGSNYISVIDTSTDTVTATVPVGISPRGVAITPNGKKVYVTNSGFTGSAFLNGNVSVIDTANDSVIVTVPVGTYPLGIAISPDGSKVYVGNDESDNISVIDTATDTVIDSVPLGFYSLGFAVTRDGNKLYVANPGNNTVSLIDISTNTVIATVKVASEPLTLVISPDGTKVYVVNYGSGTVSIIDTSTNTVIATVHVGIFPWDIAVSPDGSKVYVDNQQSGTVSVIDTTTNIVTATVGVGIDPLGLALTPDGKHLYVLNRVSNDVSVIDTTANIATDTINGFVQPQAFGQFIGPLLQTILPVANFSSNATDGYTPLDVQFTNLSTNATDLQWNFGDGSSNVSVPNPEHIFTSTGSFNVVLTASNANGSDSKSMAINVQKATPTITWNKPADITYGTALSGTQLNAVATDPVTGATVDGTYAYNPTSGTKLSIGNAQNLHVQFTPSDPTIYNAASKDVKINVQKATPTITWSNPSDIVYKIPLGSTQLNAVASVPGTFVYTPNVGKVLSAGSYTLKAVFTPTDTTDYNKVTQTVTINVLKAIPTITWKNPADIVSGTALSSTQLNAKASVPGTFLYNPLSGTILSAGQQQVLQTVFTPTDTTDYNTATASVTINVDVVPQADFSASTTSGKVPLPVTFTDQSTGSPSLWTWKFGDGSSLTSKILYNPVHTYTKKGKYTVSLTVKNVAGSSTKTMSITVK